MNFVLSHQIGNKLVCGAVMWLFHGPQGVVDTEREEHCVAYWR